MTSEEDWTEQRSRLAAVAALATMAAEMGDVEDADPLIRLALNQLMDIQFWTGRLLRVLEEPVP